MTRHVEPPVEAIVPKRGCFERTADWVSKHRVLTAALITFIGTGTVLLYYQRRTRGKKRRAKKWNGARKEVVVIAGPPGSAMTKSLWLDLEKRGFIVYVLVHTLEEEDMVKAESGGASVTRPFLINLDDVSSRVV